MNRDDGDVRDAIQEETVRDQWEMECPDCGSDEGINIYCTMTIEVELTVDGTIENDETSTGHEWDDNSQARCAECDFEGTVKDFHIKPVTDEERSNGPGKKGGES